MLINYYELILKFFYIIYTKFAKIINFIIFQKLYKILKMKNLNEK